MKALQYSRFGGPLALVDVPEPQCPPDGVLLQVGATGVCRSDWHAWQGADPVALPHVPGHEFAGTVLEVGSRVTRWAPGARVTAPFVLGCGECQYCRCGQHQIQPGQWVAVHGCGGVGLSLVMIAVALGARVIAVDVSGTALTRAQEFGAELTIDSAGRPGADIAREVVARTDGGAHVGVDAIGHPEVAAASVASLRRRGRHIQVGLLLAEHTSTALPMDLVISRELEIYGSHGMSAREYPALLEAVANGRLRPELLVGRQVALADATGVLSALDRPAPPGMTVIVVAA